MSVLTAHYGVYRAEDLLQPGAPEKKAEIIDGELVQMTPADRYHNRIAYRFQRLFEEFCRTREGLEFGGDQEGFLLRRDPDILLSPDACLYRDRRRTGRSSWLEFAPEVVVEVLSPSNTLPEMLYKRRTYFDAGTEQFWLADPAKKTLEFFHRDGRRIVAQGVEVLRCEGVVDGLEIDLVKLFEPISE